MLKIGDKIPDFQVVSDQGEEIDSLKLKGKKFIVYFYPKDNTPGCIKEACSIRDNYQIFLKNGVPVFGISGGSVNSHQNFRKKFDLPFPLLMDEKFELAKKFGAYKPGNRVERITFLVNEEGKVEQIFGGAEGIDKVNTSNHANQIINFWEL